MQDDREDKAGVQDADNCLCRLKDIVKWYPPDRLVLDQFSLEIGRGERVMIRGNAGSGRTTLIRILDQKIEINNKINEKISYICDFSRGGLNTRFMRSHLNLAPRPQIGL